MANNIHRYSVQESTNLQLGQNGAVFESGTTAITGSFCAIQVVTATQFTALVPVDTKHIGTSGQSGDSVAGVTFTAGSVLFGNWTGFTLASGSVVAYNG